MDRKSYLSKFTNEDRKLIKLFTAEMERLNVLYWEAINSKNITKANVLLNRIKSITKTLQAEYWERADLRIPAEYLKGVGYINNITWIGAGISLWVSLTKSDINTLLNEIGPIHLDAVNSLLNNSKSYVQASLDGMQRQVISMVSELQQEKIREELAKGIIAGEGRMNDRLINYFLDNKITGFKDRGGKFWSMDRYVDMLTRTETAIANTQGTINRAIQLGITKFRVVEQPDCCEHCAEMNGEIVDISEGAVDLPPFHPNCRGYIIADMSKLDDTVILANAKAEIKEIRG